MRCGSMLQTMRVKCDACRPLGMGGHLAGTHMVASQKSHTKTPLTTGWLKYLKYSREMHT